MGNKPSLALGATQYFLPSKYIISDGELFSDATFTRASVATYFDSLGILQTADINTPRTDYLQDGSGLFGLRLEGARTNLVTHSNPESTGWTDNLSNTRTANALVAPDGTTTAPTFNMDAAQGSGAFTTFTTVADTSYTHSFFVKKVSGASDVLWVGSDQSPPWTDGGSFTLRFNTSTKEFSSVGSDVSDFGFKDYPNDWIRIFMTGTTDVTGGFSVFFIYNNDGANSGVFGVWGAQVEAGPFMSSLIETSGSTETRSTDVCTINNIDSSSWFNATEGTFFADFKKDGASSTAFGVVVQVDDGSDDDDRIAIHTKPDKDSNTICVVNTASVTEFSFEGTVAGDNSRVKAAIAYKEDDTTCSVNGSTPIVDTSVTLPSVTLTTLRIGVTAGFPQQFFGIISEIRYYDTRLADASLPILTTL